MRHHPTKSLPPLYLITNRFQTHQRPLPLVVIEALEAGVRFLQLREKDLPCRDLLTLAHELLPHIRSYGASLVINDRVDIAKAINADGVHLRSDSLPVEVARHILGPQAIIGVSAHTPEDVTRAETSGADFVVLGPIYHTASKMGFGDPIGLAPLQASCQMSQLPVYAIGGITPNRVSELRRAGAYGVAVISAILESPSIQSVTCQFLDVLSQR